MDGVGDDPGLGPGEAHRVDPEIDDRHAQQRHRDALTGGEQHVHLPAVRILGHIVGQPHQVVRRLPHRRDHHDHLVALAMGPHDVIGDGPDPVGIRDGRSAELLDDQGHEPRVPAALLAVLGPNRGRSTVGWTSDFCHNAPFTAWGRLPVRSARWLAIALIGALTFPALGATAGATAPTSVRHTVARPAVVQSGLVVRASVHQIAVLHAPPGASINLIRKHAVVQTATIDSLGGFNFHNLKARSGYTVEIHNGATTISGGPVDRPRCRRDTPQSTYSDQTPRGRTTSAATRATAT